MTTILTKKKDTAGAPAAGDLTNAAGGAELAVNTATKRLYSKDSGGNVIEIGTNPSGTTMAGNLLFSPDNTYDIGASGATRPRTLYLGTSLITPAITDSGNLTFTGTGNRITGDFSNATFANRVMFQTSTANSNTAVEAIPSGTGVNSTWTAYNNSDPTNASFISIGARSSTDGRVESSIRGTGTYLPMTFYTGSSERVRIDTSGNVGIGTSSPSSFGSPLSVYFATNPTLSIVSGNANAYLRLYSTSDNNMYLTNTGGSMTMNTANTERMRIDSSGNVGIGTSSPAYKLDVAGAISTNNNLTFTGTGNRITGDFSNATFTNRVAFQTSTTNSQTALTVLPNGTNVNSALNLYDNSDPTNAGRLAISQSTTSSSFTSGITGTGSYVPMTFVTGGSERARIDTSGNVGIGTTAAGAILHTLKTSAGAATVGAFIQNSDNTVGTEVRLGFAANTNLLSADRYGWIGYVNTGGTNGGALTFATTAGGTAATERMRIDSSGNVGIGTTTTTRAKLNIDTDGSNTSAGYGLALTNLAGGGTTWTLQCGDQGVNNGAFTIRQTGISGTTYFKIEASTGYITVPGVYTLTTGSAANVFVGTGGDLRRSTSSLKYKTDIQDATHGLAEVMQLRPVIYKGINDGETVFGGFIAEEVDALGLTEFVQYADDGSPDALAYGNMVSLLAKAIQEQQALITALTARITALENK